MSNSSTIALLCGTDDNYALPLGAMLHSAAVHLDPQYDLHVFVMTDGLTPETTERLHRVARNSPVSMQIEFIAPDMNLAGLTLLGHLSPASYYRLMAPSVIPASFDRAIYLDCDMIVQDDLAKIWNQNLDGIGLMAVPDYRFDTFAEVTSFDPKQFGIDPTHPYFNSGFLFINLPYWRSHNIPEKALEFCRSNPPTIDQDGLNVALVDQWNVLPPEWNVQLDVASHYWNLPHRTLRENVNDGTFSLLHYTSKHKPWNTLAQKPGENVFFQYLKGSGWFSSSEYASWYVNTRWQATKSAVSRRLA